MYFLLYMGICIAMYVQLCYIIMQGGDKTKDSGHSKSAAASDESEGGSPLIMSNKNQRAKDDQNLKVI